ncbi:hypothetical protein MA16_Dca021365 [Dendrobium catenatum]|uniref:Aspartic peptidase DDI1-type domain-containing protein n=1 Tax=Dendrobium catenatum TaxID=906689 RepID=A0A2I0WBZ9_9ASPA|nr:hypothetical protein MA16_Dca021365 [Dendrobium catenatum]
MPTYAKFIMDILNKKRNLGEFKTIALAEKCSAIIQKKLPKTLNDPSSFFIPIMIGDKFCGRALCDLGSSINFIPLSIFKN